MVIKKIDFSYIVFGILTVFLLSTFWYIIEIGKKSSIKYNSMNEVENLILLNQKVDEFLIKRLKHVNFDLVSKNCLIFNKTIKILINEELMIFDDKDMFHKVNVINKKFNKKVKEVEIFKSNSSLFVSSIHYLLALNNFIQKRYYFSPILTKTQEISLFFTQSLFESGDIYKIKKSIKDLQSLYVSNHLADEQIKSFIEHAEYAVINIDILDAIIKQNDFLDLDSILVSLKKDMQKSIENSLEKEKKLQYILFLLDAIGLLLLILIYRRLRLNQDELYRFKKAIENSDNSIIITDANRIINYVNDAVVKNTGYSKKELIGQKPSLFKSGKMEQLFYDAIDNKIENNQKWEGEFINRRKNGTLYHEKSSIVPIEGNHGIKGYLSIKLDVTDYIEQKEELIEKTQRLNEAQRIAHIGHWELFVETGVMHVSKEVKRIFEFLDLNKDIHFKNFLDLVQNSDVKNILTAFRKSINSKVDTSLELKIITNSGKEKYLQINMHKIYDNQDNISSVNGTVQDISNLVLAREKINFIAYHDSLTKLDNRISFESKLKHAIELSKRNKKMLAVMFIDLDRFKIVNDNLGHHIGDKLLKVISKRLSSVIRSSDTLARLGGDEFGIFIEIINKQEELSLVAKKLLKEIEKPVKFNSYTLNVTASIGISFYPENGADVKTLLTSADSAMYLAKEKGKNNFQFFTETLSQNMNRRYSIEKEMRSALKKGEFSLVYQPQYDLISKKVKSFESLLRWQNENLGQISPVEFIPIAEESGMIVTIGEFVLIEACKTYKKLEKLNIAPRTFAVNVSSIQLQQDNIIETFKNILEKENVKPSSVEIEITESYLVETSEQNLPVLDDLRDIGFKISVDDFGTGYSSMSYLKNLPLNILKIDKSFVDDLPHGQDDIAITKAIISLAKNFNYMIIAEGIETKEQEEFLKKEGCEIGQGYYYSKPLGLEDLINFIHLKEENK